MIRAALLAMALSSLVASAESPEAAPPSQEICADCLVLTPDDVEQEKAAVRDLVRRAFEAGKTSQRASCASLI